MSLTPNLELTQLGFLPVMFHCVHIFTISHKHTNVKSAARNKVHHGIKGNSYVSFPGIVHFNSLVKGCQHNAALDVSF